jgi:hypothetical protein
VVANCSKQQNSRSRSFFCRWCWLSISPAYLALVVELSTTSQYDYKQTNCQPCPTCRFPNLLKTNFSIQRVRDLFGFTFTWSRKTLLGCFYHPNIAYLLERTICRRSIRNTGGSVDSSRQFSYAPRDCAHKSVRKYADSISILGKEVNRV